MVEVETINEIRPKLLGEFQVDCFTPRTEAIARAYEWGKQIHGGQTRLSGEPYFETHCGWVAAFIDRLVQNEAWTIAALLHDAVEDQGETIEEIRSMFPGKLGDEVAHIIDGSPRWAIPGMADHGSLKRRARLPCSVIQGFLVKLADKSHNLMTLTHVEGKTVAGQWRMGIWQTWASELLSLAAMAWRRLFHMLAWNLLLSSQVDSDPRLNIDFIAH